MCVCVRVWKENWTEGKWISNEITKSSEEESKEVSSLNQKRTQQAGKTDRFCFFF